MTYEDWAFEAEGLMRKDQTDADGRVAEFAALRAMLIRLFGLFVVPPTPASEALIDEAPAPFDPEAYFVPGSMLWGNPEMLREVHKQLTAEKFEGTPEFVDRLLTAEPPVDPAYDPFEDEQLLRLAGVLTDGGNPRPDQPPAAADGSPIPERGPEEPERHRNRSPSLRRGIHGWREREQQPDA